MIVFIPLQMLCMLYIHFHKLQKNPERKALLGKCYAKRLSMHICKCVCMHWGVFLPQKTYYPTLHQFFYNLSKIKRYSKTTAKITNLLKFISLKKKRVENSCLMEFFYPDYRILLPYWIPSKLTHYGTGIKVPQKFRCKISAVILSSVL